MEKLKQIGAVIFVVALVLTGWLWWPNVLMAVEKVPVIGPVLVRLVGWP